MATTTVIRSQQDMERLVADVRRDFAGLKFEPFMQSEMRLMEKAHNEYWTRQAGPSGNPWKPNAPATIKRKRHSVILVGIRPKGPGEPKLRDSLTMPYAEGAIRITVDEWPLARMHFGTDVWYSPIHNDGTAKLAKREHVGLTPQHVDGIATRATDYAFGQMQT